ncbi:hypothetical protein N1851_028931 [Merluccius polli]|uniref:Uncharacterized protein n=1 Tax=Merluccius polli TaxID=89951 RepID=A0AA47M7V4_MERPO|nr:hypothetical protein N1851_028931 [Merluccius polli]
MDWKKRQMNKGQEGDGMVTEGSYKKELTVIVEMVGEEKISAIQLMRKIKEMCGELQACRSAGERTYEITMSVPSGKEKVMDGFKIREVNIIGKELSNDEVMVSFMGLPAYTTEEEIKAKLNLWGVSAVSPVKRRMWPGTQIADGTRFVRVKFNKTAIVTLLHQISHCYGAGVLSGYPRQTGCAFSPAISCEIALSSPASNAISRDIMLGSVSVALEEQEKKVEMRSGGDGRREWCDNDGIVEKDKEGVWGSDGVQNEGREEV